MKTVIPILLIIIFHLNIQGQQISTSDFINKINSSPKDKLEYFKNLSLDFVEKLDKSDVSEVDKVFVELLKAQTIIQDNYNTHIYQLDNYDEIETIIYSDKNLHSKAAKEFEKYVHENGFVIQTPEGMVFIEKDPDFLTQTFNDYLSKNMKMFLKQYSAEIDEPFGQDGGITISFESFRQRVLFWEQFEIKNPDFVLPDYAKNQYDFYLYHLLSGMDNTPSFDWETKKLSKDYKETYNSIINEFPSSTTSMILKEYLDMLGRNDFENSKEAQDFIEKFKPYK
jgi:hypothetical protein